jgi:magnesium-transporting ATPase (P-type)
MNHQERKNTEPSSQDKDVFDPNFTSEDFNKQIISGKGRWLFTILSIASFVFLVLLIFGFADPEIYYPIHLKGHTVLVIIIFASIFWSILAWINWKNWIRKQ